MIYFVAAIMIGMFSGVTLEYFIDVKLIRDLEEENKRLHKKLEAAKKTQRVEHVETVEIVDRRQPKDVMFGGF